MKKLMLLFDDAKVHEKTDSIKFLQRIGFLFQRNDQYAITSGAISHWLFDDWNSA